MGQAQFQKRLREKARQEKQALKRERRAERAQASDDDTDEVGDVRPPEVILEELKQLHEQFDDGSMTFEDFEAAKDELVQALTIQ